MMPKGHVLLSIPVALIYFYLTRDILITSVFILASIIIDIDHVLDYVIEYKRFRPKHFLKAKWWKHRMSVVLHSYEILIACFIVFYFTKNNIFLAFAFGAFYHVVLDMIYYRSKPIFFSFIYRAVNGFNMKVFCNG